MENFKKLKEDWSPMNKFTRPTKTLLLKDEKSKHHGLNNSENDLSNSSDLSHFSITPD